MEVYEIAYLFLGLATLVAAGTIINYSRKRSAATSDSDIKKAFRPLYLFAFGLIIYAIGALLTYYELLVEIPFIQIYGVINTNYYLLYYITMFELLLLAISASMIMEQRIIGLFMIIMIAVAYLLMFNAILILEQTRVSNIAQLYINYGYVLTMIILGAAAFLFSWIAYETKRSTSLALGYAMIVQVLAVPGLYSILSLEIIIAISIFALMGPAMIAFAFLRPDQKISGELVGYGASFAGPVAIVAALISTQTTFNPEVVLLAGVGALALMLATGTTSYLYGRWRETRQIPTGLLLLAFIGFAVGQVVGMLGAIGVIIGVLPSYIEILSVGFALSIFSVVAIFAAGYRSAGLIPFLIYIPAAIFIGQGYTQGLVVSEAFLQYIWIVIPLIILFFVPVILFLGTWRRMKSTGATGRSRPLGMGVALFLYILIRLPLMLFETEVSAFLAFDPSYALVVLSFGVFWLSLTGRMEKS
ncbi:MAG: hypothetical protein ACFFDM_03525 [Candidatus Thorarchaeota archaeon]